MKVQLTVSKADSERMRAHGPSGGLGQQQLNGVLFARMLAKIAHGLAFSSLKDDYLSKLEMLLPDLILNGKGNAFHLVGMNKTIRPALKGRLHETVVTTAASDNDEFFLAAKIRLFADMGTPDYIVIIARVKEPLSTNDASPEASGRIIDKTPDPSL